MNSVPHWKPSFTHEFKYVSMDANAENAYIYKHVSGLISTLL